MNENPLSKVRPGRPPADLREKVLQAAAMPAHPAPHRRWRRFDLALVASILLLVVCHAVLSLSPPHTGQAPIVAHRSRQTPSTEQHLRLDAELIGMKIEAADHVPDERPLTLETVLRTTS
jgi:hypothetical protein